MNTSQRTRGFTFLMTAILLAGQARCAGQPASTPPEGVPPQRVSLLDLSGRRVDPFQGPHAKATVFVFTRTDCPISNRYAPEVRRLYAKFSPRHVTFWLVYLDPSESVGEIRKHLREYQYELPALRDPEHRLVKLTGVQVTPEVAVFVSGQSGEQMVYRGRIDDRYVDFGKSRPAPTTHDLEQVLIAIVAGRPTTPRNTHAVGCFIQDLK